MDCIRNYLPPDEVDCVVYHSPCGDGFGGAYVFWKYLREVLKVDDIQENDRVKFIAYNHRMNKQYIRDNLLPQIQSRNVVYIDMCPPRDDDLFYDMLIDPEKAIVLDHHKSALETTEHFPSDFVFKHCYIDQRYSGCMLAHQYCYPDTEPPTFLKYIEDRDIWAWKYKEFSEPFTEAFYKSVPFNFKEYAKFEDEDKVKEIINDGNVLSKYKKLRVKELAKKAKETELTINDKTYNVHIINTTEHISELGHELSQMDCHRLEKKCDFAILWNYDERHGNIKISVRSDSDIPKEEQVDVSAVAMHFGGGGHFNAGGFTLTHPDFLLNALNKESSDKVTMKRPPTKYKKKSKVDYFGIAIKAFTGMFLVGCGIFLGKSLK